MDVGVVIPVRDTSPRLLADCLKSVSLQDGAKAACPVIVVDDGSRSHGSIARVCRESGLANLELVRLPNQTGMAAARNEGVARLTTEFVVLLDSDDLLHPRALSGFAAAITPEVHLIYADHVWVEMDGQVLAVRRKSAYQRLLQRYAQTSWSPFLHATFIFHPQVFRVSTYTELGGLDESWGYGDEVELHLRIEAQYGYTGCRHIKDILYWYRRNPASVVHDPALYARLIDNIESILLARMRAFFPDVSTCRRKCRAISTHAAHYEYERHGVPLDVPWFDAGTCDLREAM